MDFSLSDGLLTRQRCRQYTPLITQQFRFRDVHQVLCCNLPPLRLKDSYYFTLHTTTMSAPFYTSDKIDSVNPKWPELDQRDLTNLSATAVVVRIWCHSTTEESDSIISTWGINLSGLDYLGCKVSEIQPRFFNKNTVILFMRGGYFTSYNALMKSGIRHGDTGNEHFIRYSSLKMSSSDVAKSYNLVKLRRLHSLQIAIKNQLLDVQNMRDKIELKLGGGDSEETNEVTHVNPSTSSLSNVRYAPQLLTMNTLNKMLELKPTKWQQKEMVKTRKQLEVAQFKNKLLSCEKDRKSVSIRKLKNKLGELSKKIEEKNTNLMDSYYNLSREAEKLKELRQTIFQNHENYSLLHSQLHMRRKQLLQELLFIYPIQQYEKKFTIHGIHLPDSDYLTDCSDMGVSVALGYVTHVLLMCSNFLQVPLRYPLTHYGSRSYVTDNISPIFPDRERDFPLFTKGQDRMQFTYAVYLLNKNIAQLRWLLCIHTTSLKMTLPNLFGLLQGAESRELALSISMNLEDDISNGKSVSNVGFAPNFNNGENSRIPQERKYALPRMFNTANKCGPGLSEILAIPEAFMNRQISSDSFKNYVALKKTCDEEPQIVIKEGRSEENICDIKDISDESIEQGTDLLDPTFDFNEMSQSLSEETNTNNGAVGNCSLAVNQSSPLEESSDDQLSTPAASLDGSLPRESPLTVRTDALLHTKSFNLVKPKSNL